MDWTAVAERQTARCPVLRFEGHLPHEHPAAQLVHVVLGGACVVLGGSRIELAEGDSVWIPGGVTHAVELGAGGVMLGPFVDVDPPGGVAQVVSDPAVRRLMTVLLSVAPRAVSEVLELREEIGQVLLAVVDPYFAIEAPCHPAASLVARRAAVSGRPLEDLAADVFLSVRQVQRIFRRETGLSFSDWRTRARLNLAIGRLRSGGTLAEAQTVAGFATREGLDRAARRATGRALADTLADA
ncbi:MAG: helix-turn-helix domain-containing protein [Actinomycetaceae bacterium]